MAAVDEDLRVINFAVWSNIHRLPRRSVEKRSVRNKEIPVLELYGILRYFDQSAFLCLPAKAGETMLRKPYEE